MTDRIAPEVLRSVPIEPTYASHPGGVRLVDYFASAIREGRRTALAQRTGVGTQGEAGGQWPPDNEVLQAFCDRLNAPLTIPAAPQEDMEGLLDMGGLVKKLREFPNFFTVDGSHWLRGSEIDPLCLDAADAIETLRRERAAWKDEALNNRTYREQVLLACNQRNEATQRAELAEGKLSAARDEGIERLVKASKALRKWMNRGTVSHEANAEFMDAVDALSGTRGS